MALIEARGCTLTFHEEMDTEMHNANTQDVNMSVAITDIIQVKQITESDVIDLRTKVFKDGIFSQKQAATLIALERVCDETCQAWSDYYVTALSDYILCRTEPTGGISDENTEWLKRALTRNGLVKSATEFQLLKTILERAVPASPSFCALVLDQVHYVLMGFPDDYEKPDAFDSNSGSMMPGNPMATSIDVIDKLRFLETAD